MLDYDAGKLLLIKSWIVGFLAKLIIDFDRESYHRDGYVPGLYVDERKRPTTNRSATP